MKDNKLIAEFMGLKPCDDREQYQSSIHTNVVADLKYHTSWDWLMPVVQKCYKVDNEEGFDNLVDSVATLNIEATYNAVIKFIKEK